MEYVGSIGSAQCRAIVMRDAWCGLRCNAAEAGKLALPHQRGRMAISRMDKALRLPGRWAQKAGPWNRTTRYPKA